MKLSEIVKQGTVREASDIHITVGSPIIFRINGILVPLNDRKLNPEDTKSLVFQALDDRLRAKLKEKGEIDTSYSIPGVGRYRVSAFLQRGSYSMVFRIIPLRVPTMEELGLPSIVKTFSEYRRGLILVTGPTGSGKSTTLATIIDKINSERKCHILTLEDPIEYLHKHKKSIVNQREIGSDSKNFKSGLRAALRQDPDVILVGEMRDLETISIALTAAETGHLVLSTLHTSGAAKTIDRIIDVFPAHQQQQARVQLSSVLQAVISQQLLLSTNEDRRVAAFEIMLATPAIRNLIREDKIHQIDISIQTGSNVGMITMDKSLIDLFRRGLISRETAIRQAVDQNEIRKYI